MVLSRLALSTRTTGVTMVHVDRAVVDDPVGLDQGLRLPVLVLRQRHRRLDGAFGKRGDLFPDLGSFLALRDKLNIDQVGVGPGDENLFGTGQALGVEGRDDAARHSAVVANDGVDRVCGFGQKVFRRCHRLVGRPALVRLIGNQLEIGIFLQDLENPAAHRVGVGVAGLSPDQRDVTLDRSVFGLEPRHHRLRLQLADRPAILHYHGVERTVEQHRIVADHPHAGLVRRGHHASGGAGIDRLQHDDLRALRQHVFERGELGLLVVVGGIKDHIGAKRPGPGQKRGFVSLVTLFLHGLEQEADLDFIGRGSRIDRAGKGYGQQGRHPAQDAPALEFHASLPENFVLVVAAAAPVESAIPTMTI